VHEWKIYAPQHIAAQQLLAERQLARDVFSEEAQQTRHTEIGGKLDKLKEPHWTLPWTFWVVVATFIVAILAWLFPRH
jgi:hypothetical protein